MSRRASCVRPALLLLGLAAAAPAQHGFEPTAPSFNFLQHPAFGLPAMPMPDDYAPTAAMFDLGRRLFDDGILSRDRSVSCATCHPATTGFASPAPRPLGIGAQPAQRHAPALWNRGYGRSQRWDGSSPTLERFVLEPIADPREMDLPIADALARLTADPGYRDAFAAAFGNAPDETALRRALATFVRGIVAGDAPYDHFVRGEVEALTTQQRHGLWIFESKGGCWRCHPPPLFTDERFHATGVGVVDGEAEPGRAAVTGEPADRGRFKTPTLRGARLTAPYMHDGALATLRDVVAFYVHGGNEHADLDPHIRRLDLGTADQEALVAFLESL